MMNKLREILPRLKKPFTRKSQPDDPQIIWYLTDIPGDIPPQPNIRSYSVLRAIGGGSTQKPVNIKGGSSELWVTLETIRTEPSFPVGRWSGKLTRTDVHSAAEAVAEIGIWDGNKFTRCGKGKVIFEEGAKTARFVISARTFEVPFGKWLALRLTNTAENPQEIMRIPAVGESYVIPPRERGRLAFLTPVATIFALLLLMALLIAWVAPKSAYEVTPYVVPIEEGVIAQQGPLHGYWRFNEGQGLIVNDASGWENQGTFGLESESPEWEIDSLYDSAIYFDGIDDVIEMGYGSRLGIRRPLSVSAWVKMESLPADDGSMAIISRSSSSRINYWLGIVGAKHSDKGTYSFGFRREDQNGLEYEVFSNTVPQTGKWYEVTAVDDGSNFKMYVNGVLEDTVRNSGLFVYETKNHKFKIGATNKDIGKGTSFHGWIDQPRVYESDRLSSAGGVAINEVVFAGGNKWIELYNKGDFPVDLKGWVIFDNSGERIIDLEGKNLTVGAHGYHIFYQNEYSGLANLDEIDYLAAYDLDPDNHPTPNVENGVDSIVGFVAWGASPEEADDDAVTAGLWGNNDFVTSTGYEGILLLKNGNNDDGVQDWSVEAIADATPEAAVPDMSAAMLFAMGLGTILAGYLIWRRKHFSEATG